MRREVEAWGVTYERYALGKLQQRLVDELSINQVAELPAHGAKAMPSIYSIGFGSAGAKVTLVNGKEDYRQCWQKLGLHENADFTKVKDIMQTGIEENSYDFVWNFAYLPLSDKPDELIEEMKRISKRYVACFSVNFGNVGFSHPSFPSLVDWNSLDPRQSGIQSHFEHCQFDGTPWFTDNKNRLRRHSILARLSGVPGHAAASQQHQIRQRFLGESHMSNTLPMVIFRSGLSSSTSGSPFQCSLS